MNKHLDNFILLLLVVSTALLGLSFGLGANDRAIERVAQFFLIESIIPTTVMSAVTGLLFAAVSVLAALKLKHFQVTQPLVLLLAILSIVPLLSLFSDSRWIASLGGFPAIGSGQGVIKYFALLAIALYLLKPNFLTERQIQLVNYFPVMLVLLWIGGMKFTELEAKGIEDLIAQSPLMFWLYDLFDVQMTSNLIGVFDIIALALLGLGLKYNKLLIPGILMSGSVFVVTQTFLFSTSGVFSADTVITGTGQFLIKDLWFIANLAVVYMYQPKS